MGEGGAGGHKQGGKGVSSSALRAKMEDALASAQLAYTDPWRTAGDGGATLKRSATTQGLPAIGGAGVGTPFPPELPLPRSGAPDALPRVPVSAVEAAYMRRARAGGDGRTGPRDVKRAFESPAAEDEDGGERDEGPALSKWQPPVDPEAVRASVVKEVEAEVRRALLAEQSEQTRALSEQVTSLQTRLTDTERRLADALTVASEAEQREREVCVRRHAVTSRHRRSHCRRAQAKATLASTKRDHARRLAAAQQQAEQQQLEAEARHTAALAEARRAARGRAGDATPEAAADDGTAGLLDLVAQLQAQLAGRAEEVARARVQGEATMRAEAERAAAEHSVSARRAVSARSVPHERARVCPCVCAATVQAATQRARERIRALEDSCQALQEHMTSVRHSRDNADHRQPRLTRCADGWRRGGGAWSRAAVATTVRAAAAGGAGAAGACDAQTDGAAPHR